MILGTYNVENMFDRVKAMNFQTWKQGEPILDDFYQLSELIEEPVYTDPIKKKLLAVMAKYPGLVSLNRKNQYIRLRENHGKLLKKPKGKPWEIPVPGRGAWTGWFELETEPTSGPAVENCARIIGLVNPDVLSIVEVENRIALNRFNDKILPKVGAERFEHTMVIDGNDDRGIDVGVMAKKGYDIVRMLSHVDDKDPRGEIFSRDCAEYEISTPKNNTLLLLVNHFKSKSGPAAATADKRRRQAERVRAIYDSYVQKGRKYIAVTGDFNSSPSDSSMAPLLVNSGLTDVMDGKYPALDAWPGTFGDANKNDKFDYILMSPDLEKKLLNRGINRQGVWAGGSGNRFGHLPTITGFPEAASDHAALWVELDI